MKDNYDKKHSMDLRNIKTVFVNTRTENSIKTLTPCVKFMHLSIKKIESVYVNFKCRHRKFKLISNFEESPE